MDERMLVEILLVGQRFAALEKMSVDALMIEIAHSARTGIPFSANLLVAGAMMFHLRVEHDGARFVGRIFSGFSIDERDQVAIADNGFLGVAEAAYEAIVAPDMIDNCVLEEEC